MQEQDNPFVPNEKEDMLLDNGPRPNDIQPNDDLQKKPYKNNRNMILIIIIVVLLLSGTSRLFSSFSFLTRRQNLSLRESVSNSEELFLEGRNGSIIVEGYDGKDIQMNIRYQQKMRFGHSKVDLKIKRTKDQLYLDYDKNKISALSMEVQIPRDVFKTLTLNTSNGRIEMKDLNIESSKLETSNADIIVEEWNGKKLKMQTSNGAVSLEDAAGDEVELKTSNGSVNVDGVEGKSMTLKTSNGRIAFESDELKAYDRYDWKIETSNGSIYLDLPDKDEIGYKVDAETSNSTITHEISNFKSEDNSKKELEGQTNNYDQAKIKVEVEVDTSNGSITIE